MIHNIISALGARTNQYVKNKLSIDDDIVIVRNLVDIKGNLSQGIENKIVLFLLSIEEEKLAKNSTLSHSMSNPSINLNINIMFATNFTDVNYVESLRNISLIIDFFQRNPIFTLSDTPGLPLSIPRLHVELYNLNMPDTMRLWGAIGTKYVPSCAYRIKQVLFDSDTIIEDTPPVLGN
ncbi:MAG: hypothetical protein CMP52_04350 [Flavobacteriales bacterium]|jgi:hypothetical protein|nr:hypothetical protein [Candidatus Arcticimaribacter sp.]|tara:strand:+ start:1031 stop:1567 length:537 start_codon:yes stop_codon:yes gene_type:complete